MENQKNNTKLYIIITVLSFLLLILGGYVIYKFLFSSDQNNIDNTLNESVDYSDYKILNDKYNYYLIKADGKDYKVVYDLGYGIHYIGIHNNKMYYSDKSIKYIDLGSDKFTEKVLLEIPQEDDYIPNYISKSAIINNTLYFNLSNFSAGKDEYDGVLSISLDSNNFNDFKQIIADADLDRWYADEDNSKIYYAKFNYGNGVIPYEYNIKTETNTLLSDVKYIQDIRYNNGIMLYYYYEGDRYDSSFNLIYSCNCTPHYELYLYDTNNKSVSLITKEIYKDTSGGLYRKADIFNDKIYYYTSDGVAHIYDYKTKTSSDYYSIPDMSDNYDYSFGAIDENTIELIISTKGGVIKDTQYVVNGKIVDSLDEIKVTMLDDSIKTFTIENITKVQ